MTTKREDFGRYKPHIYRSGNRWRVLLFTKEFRLPGIPESFFHAERYVKKLEKGEVVAQNPT